MQTELGYDGSAKDSETLATEIQKKERVEAPYGMPVAKSGAEG